MNNFQQEIYKTIDILTDEKLKQLGFDKTKRGKVVSISGETCIVEIDGDNYTCKLRKGIYIQPSDIVFVKFPQNNNVDKYVDVVLGNNEIPEYLVISAEEILAKLKTVDGEGSGLDADMLDGKHGSEFATKEDIAGISIDGDTIVQNINSSTAIINDKNLSDNVNDTISKKHIHDNKTTLDGINDDTVANWNTVSNKVDKIDGYGLSQENYTLQEKIKLATIETDAEKNKVNSVNNKTGDVVINKADIDLGSVEDKSSATIRNEITKTNITNALGYTPESNSNKGVANGYAPLDSNIKIPLSMLPDIAKQQTYVVETIADRDSLTGLIMGEKCYITTLGDSYIWDGTKWVTLAKADWENVNLQWTNIVGKPQSNVADIDDATSKRHIHSNKNIIDTITQTLIDRWNSAWNHISDAIMHITSAERAKWNTVDNKADTTYVDTELNKKSDKGHIHTEIDISDLDKYTKAETDAKLNLKQDKLGYTPLKEIPIASPTLLGGIKVGNNLTITEDGTLSALDSDEKSSFIVKQELFVATEGQTLFTLTKGTYQPNTNTISISLYGGKQPNISFNELSSTTFEFHEPLKQGDVVLVDYIELSSAEPYPIHGDDHLTGGYDPIPKATTVSDGLMAKEDKTKLNNIEDGANKYIHPSTHSLNMITETTDKKILTASERNKISEIDNKIDKIDGKGLSDENYTLAEKNKLAGITNGATKNDTDANLKNRANHTGTQPSSTISDFASTVRDTVLTGLSTATNTVITTTDTVLSALGKLQRQISDNLSTLINHIGNKNNPHGTTKSHVGLGNVDNIQQATKAEFNTHNNDNTRHITSDERSNWNNYYRGNWTYEDFYVNGESDKYYPVHITGLNMNEATISYLEIYRGYSWTAPDDWYSSTHKGGLNLCINYSLAGWGGQSYELQLTLAQTYSRMVADVITASPDTSSLLVWLRGGGARYRLRKQDDSLKIKVYDGVQNLLPFKNKEGTQYEVSYDLKASVESWFDFIGMKKVLTTESKLYIGGGFRNPKNSVEIYHANNKPTPKDVGLGNVSNYTVASQAEAEAGVSNQRYMTPLRAKQAIDKFKVKDTSELTKSDVYNKTEVDTKLNTKVDNSRVLTDVPVNAKFTDTTYDNATTSKDGLMSREDKTKLDGIENGANKYIHPSSHSASMINETADRKFMTPSEKTKLTGIEDGANKYSHPSTHPASMITESTTRRFVSDTEKASWNNKAEISDIPTKVGQLENDKNYVTQAELGDAGYGDMLKSIYDKNNDGKVDLAELADKLGIVDTRSDASPPSYYFGLGRNMMWEFKNRSAVGNPPTNASASGTYAFILTITGWANSSGGYPVQMSIGGKNLAIRQGISTTTWGSWYTIANISDLPTKLSQLQLDVPLYHVGTTPPTNNNLLWINTNL